MGPTPNRQDPDREVSRVTGLQLRVLGVPLIVAPSWLVIAVSAAGIFAKFSLPEDFEPGVVEGLSSLLTAAVIAFVSVVAHELGHAVAARKAGFTVDHIRLAFPFEHAALKPASGRNGGLALVALSGPAANLALAAIGFYLLPSSRAPIPGGLREFFVQGNLILAAFNLLPALPLDGGRVVHGTVARLTGKAVAGDRTAGICGCLTAIGLASWALWPILTGAAPTDPIHRPGATLSGIIAFSVWLLTKGLIATFTPATTSRSGP